MALRALQFVEFFAPHRGGIETHVETLATQLHDAGLEVAVATPYPGPGAAGPVRVHRIHAPLLPGLQTIFTPHGARPFLLLLERTAPDVVHCHLSIYNPATLGAAYLAHRAGLPVVVTMHSLLGPYAHAYRALDRLIGWSRLPFSWTGIGATASQQLSHLLGGRPVPVLPPAFDAEPWRPAAQAERARAGTFRLVSTMRLAKRKRPHALLDVLAEARRCVGKARRLELTIIGEGPEREALQRRSARLGLADDVRFRGTLPPERIRAEYATADAFVLPAVEESFGLAVLEARTAGLPVLVRAGSGPAAFIQGDVEGVIAESDAALADAVVQLATDSARHVALRRHNVEVPPSFSRATTVAAHRETYLDALRRRP